MPTQQDFELPDATPKVHQTTPTPHKSPVKILLVILPALFFFAFLFLLISLNRNRLPQPAQLTVSPTPTPQPTSPAYSELTRLKFEITQEDFNQPNLRPPQIDQDVNFKKR